MTCVLKDLANTVNLGNIKKIFVLKLSRLRLLMANLTLLTLILFAFCLLHFQTPRTVNSLFTGFRKWSASI